MSETKSIISAVFAATRFSLAGFAGPVLAAKGVAASLVVYVGAVTSGADGGIYLLRFDPADGTFSTPVLAAQPKNPSWIELDATGRLLYAADAHAGPVSAFARAGESGTLTLIDTQPTGGAGTSVAHFVVDATGRMLIAPDYAGGAINTYPLDQAGGIGILAQRIALSGPPGPDPRWQSHSFPHGVVLSPDNRFAYFCDRGLDRIHIFRVDAAHARLDAAVMPFVPAPRGAGPRHGVFASDGRFFYVVNELDSSASAYACNPISGALELQQTIATLPEERRGANKPGEIRIHPLGGFIYASNRGPTSNSLTVFSRDPQTGALALVQVVPCGGETPRNFTLSPDGGWLLCANQDSNSVTVFCVDSTTGRLTPTDRKAVVPRPMCVVFGAATR